MLKQHCGQDMAVIQRDIAPTAEEQSRGVLALRVSVCWCQSDECRRKQVYTQELFSLGVGQVNRIKKGLSTIAKRLQQAKESDWVWGYDRETYAKVKRPVR